MRALYNPVYGRRGTLWGRRFKASFVDSAADLVTCVRYIELNPVPAGTVSHPSEYPWSSYRAHAKGERNPLVSPCNIYLLLDHETVERQRAHRELFRVHPDPDEIRAIRAALNQELVLGRNDFKDKIDQIAQGHAPAGKAGRPRTRKAAACRRDA